MVDSSNETHVKSIECDPIVETAHVKRCVAGYPVRYDECTMGDPGIGCPLVKQRPQSIELGGRGCEAVEPDNGPELDSVTERPRQAGEVHISALTHVEIAIDGKSEPVMALADSGSQIPVIRRETIAQLNVPTLGQIKVQGIFGDPVIADLVTLQIKRNLDPSHKSEGDESYNVPSIPVMFAVTEVMAPGCDVIIPADIAAELQTGSSKLGITHREPTLTIANNSVVSDKGDMTGTTELADDEDDNKVDNIDDPLCNLINQDDSDTQALIAKQKSDTTLQPCWQLAEQQKGGMVVENGILYHNDQVCSHTIKQ